MVAVVVAVFSASELAPAGLLAALAAVAFHRSRATVTPDRS